jgi:hypothetical protein
LAARVPAGACKRLRERRATHRSERAITIPRTRLWDRAVVCEDSLRCRCEQGHLSTVTPISIYELNAFATHCGDLPERRTFAEEFRVFEVVGRITYAAREDDRDYHIAIEDPNSPGSSVVAELADTACAGAVISPHFATLRTAEAMFETLRGGQAVGNLIGTTVRVRGVGFYDFAHGQRGRSSKLH